MAKLKIVFVSYNNGRILRGGEIAVNEYSKRFIKFFNVWVIQGGHKQSKKYPSIVIKTQPNWHGRDFSGTIRRLFFVDSRSLAIAKFSIDAIRELNKINADIVIPVNDGWQSIILRIWALLKGKKIIFIASSGRSWESIVNLLLFPHLFIALTENVRKWALRINPLIKIVTISNGVDTSLFKPLKSHVKIHIQKPIYLGVGAITGQKRWDLLIRAVAKLKTGSVLLIGQGPKSEYIDMIGQKLLGPGRYKRIPKIEHSELVPYYNLSNVFTMPSNHSEGQGIVYLEAMACNKPVVATLDSQRLSTVQNGGSLIDPTNIDEYANTLWYTSSHNWHSIPRKTALKKSWNMAVNQFIVAIYRITKSNE